jgi:triphosphoribosyl-dephospho-CoA synthetase
MPFLLTIANFFGINVFRLVAYAVIAASVTTGLVVVRQHYVNKGYASAIAAVKKQDDKAKAAAERVETKAATCSDKNRFWDVISQSCKLDDAP